MGIYDTRYSVVGRYMSGNRVYGYHILGADGTQLKVSKDAFIDMVEQGLVVNCKVQQVNNEKILRGNGINILELPIYKDQVGLKIKKKEKGEQVVKNPISSKRFRITNLIRSNDEVIGFEVVSDLGEHKKLSKNNVAKLLEQGMIINANDILKYFNIVDISMQDLKFIGNQKHLTLANDDAVDINDLRQGRARIYLQIVNVLSDKVSIEEFVTYKIKFGKNKGVIMRIGSRGNKEQYDIRENSIDVQNYSEKSLIAILCCGVMKVFNSSSFYSASIQLDDASASKQFLFT